MSTVTEKESILVAYTETSRGFAALSAGASLARKLGADLRVLHVLTGDAPLEDAPTPERMTQRVTAAMSEIDFHFEVVSANVDESVVDCLERHSRRMNPLLFVIGLRHRSLVGKLVFGSTAQQLLLRIPCPVVAVKDEA